MYTHIAFIQSDWKVNYKLRLAVLLVGTVLRTAYID